MCTDRCQDLGQRNHCILYIWDIQRNVLPKFIEICMEMPWWCPSDGHQHCGWKPTETLRFTEFCFKSVNLFLEELINIKVILFLMQAVFSLNFSSAGKGPFMDGKAKNIYFSKRGGGGAVEWGTWTRPHWEIFYSHILRPILRKSAVVIFRQQVKTFDSNNFTMPLMFSFQNACP